MVRAHPRSRGENRRHRRALARVHGSSPLTRGKRAIDRRAVGVGGLIPAHAGKTRSCPRRRPRGRAHPRSRGENNQDPESSWPPAGSSPLTRGKRESIDVDARVRGLIPAHAGKTGGWCGPRWRGRAHPRSRGENPTGARASTRGSGSSPLTRGKLVSQSDAMIKQRLIPAHAGKTRFPSRPTRRERAHPRSRGENARSCTTLDGADGSSPLTRGKPEPR